MAEILKAGKKLETADKVAILIHGRGANAGSILSLQDHLKLEDFALLAPQAPGNTWYPYGFMAPDKANDPFVSQAIGIIDELVKDILEKGFLTDQICFIGFSQGACLGLEYTARHAGKYKGVIAFTGGLIGEQLNEEKYRGDFQGTPVFIGASQQDMHVPLARIKDSARLLENMNAAVSTLIFQDSQHTIRPKEVEWVNANILK